MLRFYGRGEGSKRLQFPNSGATQAPASSDSAEYDEIVVCYCRYSPIEPEWKELPKIGVLQEGKL